MFWTTLTQKILHWLPAMRHDALKDVQWLQWVHGNIIHIHPESLMFDPQMDLELDNWTSVISLAQLRIDAYAHAALGKCYGKCYGMV